MTVALATTSTALSATTVSPAYGQSVTFNATVTGNSPTGIVTFKDGATSLGTVALTGNDASFPTTALTSGGHSITAVYNGDANNQVSPASAAVSVTVGLAPTATSLSASSTTPEFGQSVSFTATISGNSPTGTVTFMDGATTLATVGLTGNSAIYATTSLTSGGHSITAVYNGDTNNQVSQASSAAGVTVGLAATTTALSASSSAPAFGQDVSFSATVTGNTPTGTVTFKDGAAALGTVALTGNTANFATTALASGTHSITAVYNGDSSNQASPASSEVGVTVALAQSTTALSASTATAAFGQSVSFTATVAGNSPTGTVTFKDGAETLGTVALTGDSASYATTALTSGTHSITAVYNGDTGNQVSPASAAVGLTVALAPTTTTVLASTTTPPFGQSVSFSATVAGNSPTGTVTFQDGTATLGTVELSGGTATYTTSALSSGDHSISAVYNGDTQNQISSGTSAVNVTVGLAPTSTALSANTTTPVFGQSVSFSATVTGNSPTGTVSFKDGTTTMGTVALTGNTASYATTALASGSHSITAVYNGDATNQVSLPSAAVGVTVGASPTSTALTVSTATPAVNESVSFSATVAGSSPSGTVTFKDGSTTLFTATMTGNIATYATSSLAIGAHSITASYNGSSTNTASTSGATSIVVKSPTMSALSASTTTPDLNQNVTFTLTVTGGNPTGTVTFKDGTVSLGTIALTGTTASYSITTLTAGSHSISAAYNGDANNFASASSPLNITVATAGTKTALSANTATPAQGQSITFTAAVTGNSPTGTVTFKDAAIVLGSATVTGNTATYNASGLTAGPHTISATYNGDAGNASSTSVFVVVSVAGPAPIIDVPHLTNADAGSIAGTAAVNGGRAGYSMPLTLPPGVAGMVPSVSLDYNGSTTNGIAGVGWSLTAYSAIVRCGQTIAQDGRTDAIRMTTGDRLCMDGKRLTMSLPANAGTPGTAAFDTNYWSASAEYRTDVETFARIVRTTDGFTVYSKDGRISYYGSSTDSKRLAPVGTANAVHTWTLRRVEDRSGNAMEYAYSNNADTGEFSLASIRWGANAGATPTPQSSFAKVAFEYDTRPDADTAFIAGGRADVTKRLAKITTTTDTAADGSGGVQALQYKLAYQQSPTSGRSMVKSVEVCSSTGACLPATTFTWGEPDPAVAAEYVSKGVWTGPVLEGRTMDASNNMVGPTQDEMYIPGDFNGDGRTDLMTRFGGSGTQLFTNTGSGFSVSKPFLNVQSQNGAIIETGDFDGDGQMDLLFKTGWDFESGLYDPQICHSRLREGQGFDCKSWDIDIADTSQRRVYDFNSDGRDDIYLSGGRAGDGNRGAQRLCMATATGFDCTIITSGNYMEMQRGPHLSMKSVSSLASTDIDGDGRVDMIQVGRPIYNAETNFWSFINAEVSALSYEVGTGGANALSGYGGILFDLGVPESDRASKFSPNGSEPYGVWAFGIPGDLNADGYSDIYIQNGALGGLKLLRCLSKGKFVPLHCETFASLPSQYVEFIGDVDGDGAAKTMHWMPTASIQTIKYYQSCVLRTGNSVACRQWSSKRVLSPDGVHDNYQGERTFLMDLAGDSRKDIISYQPGGKWEVLTQRSLAKTGEALDRLIQVTNGVGLATKFEYAGANDEGIYAATALDRDNAAIAANFPRRRITQVENLVKSLKASNGKGGWIETRYAYSGGASDLRGLGYLGFARIDTTDVATGIVNTSWYSQDWPFVGMLTASRQATSAASDAIRLLDATMTLATQTVAHTSGQTSVFPFMQMSVATKKDLDGSAINSATTTSTYGDGWGNQTVLDESVTGGGVTFTGKTTRTFQNTAATWLIGLPTRIVASKTRSGVTITRTKAATYDTAGLPKTQTTEPDDPALKLVTTLVRGNAFGNVSKTTQTWRNPSTLLDESRDVAEVLAFDVKGRFATKVQNAAGHAEEFVFDPSTGKAVKHITANQLTTTSTLDGFGSVTSTKAPDLTEQLVYGKQCDANCPINATHVKIVDHQRAGTRFATPSLEYFDNAGRSLRKQTWGFDGKVVVADTRYDERGRLVESDHPRFSAGTSRISSKLEHDTLNRVTSTTVYDDDNVARTTTTTYNGLTTTIRSPKVGFVQEIVNKKDATGLLDEVTDAIEGVTKYEHDAYGGLTKVTDPLNNVVTIAYDNLGRRTSLTDPDLGLVKYDIDPLGRTWREQTAKQQPSSYTTFVFDSLDRMTLRAETDLTSKWIYDTAANGKGLLAEAYTGAESAKTYRRQHAYDSFARPSTTTLTLDTSYVSTTTYDSFGRIATTAHQRGSAAAKTYTNAYSSLGYLARIERAGAVLWQLGTVDAAQRALTAVFGNGLGESQTFNSHSGRLSSASVNLPTGSSKLVEGYTYDELGNVKQRIQWWDGAGFTENFDYDNLNRLKFAQIVNQPAQSFTFDAIGNMLTKTGVGSGTYVYPASGGNAQRPHAVQSIPGVGSYGYDANGNLVSGPAGTEITWKSFNMPDTIKRNGQSSQFAYGPEHQRARQTRSSGTSLYYAGSMEVEITGDQVTVKTYWPAQLGMEIDRPGQPTELLWMHRDNLGSVVGITGADAVFKEKLSYDAWGKRRATEGTLIPNLPAGQIDNRGYTGHEMLDNVEMVHMNGRVYDPFIARFTSADPIIQDPEYSQSYNRYSYVWNNPINSTDPTGFETVEVGDNATTIRGKVRRYCSGSAMANCIGQTMNAVVNALREVVQANGATQPVADAATPTRSLENKPGSASTTEQGIVARHPDQFKDSVIGYDVRYHLQLLGEHFSEKKAETGNFIYGNLSQWTIGLADNLEGVVAIAGTVRGGGSGRAGKQPRLKELSKDDKLGSADRGWLQQEINSIKRGQRSNIRNPPGTELAHERGREAAKGYDYSRAQLQDKDLHKTQHKYDDFGRANKERPLDK